MFDLAAIAIAVGCFLVLFLLRHVLARAGVRHKTTSVRTRTERNHHGAA
ncbi:MAG TPA: hypothetical protein VIL91_13675 [Gaiellaceae bacterium]|jgi:hypothetical protein